MRKKHNMNILHLPVLRFIFGFLIHTALIVLLCVFYVCPCCADEAEAPLYQSDESSTSEETIQSQNTPVIDALPVNITKTPWMDTSINLISAFFSLVAIIVSVASLYHARKMSKQTLGLQIKHNKDEVRPILCAHFDAGDMSIIVKNHGLGPAIMTSMKWEDNDKTETTLVRLNRDKWTECGVTIDYFYTKRFLNDDDDLDVLAPQEELVLIRNKRGDHKNNLKIANSFKDVKMEIRYTDIYRDKSQRWTLKKDCSWFYYQYNK